MIEIELPQKASRRFVLFWKMNEAFEDEYGMDFREFKEPGTMKPAPKNSLRTRGAA
ncbi:hypothetical protein [Rhizobium sullae]|uniref:Uncharacterized protein n=1 Tax=Rhizobium sullae TaxID=50338 RepID=A0A4R3PTP5_RHISU|nr:hypothetical protein [Rhizobium sullae]TCU10599.1 hypothetical protein EV132_12096 [Rhizobium sullae]